MYDCQKDLVDYLKTKREGGQGWFKHRILAFNHILDFNHILKEII